MTRWLVLGLVCTGAGACAGERPQFGTMRTDDASGDGGSNQASASGSGTHTTTSDSTTNNASPTSAAQDSSTTDDTSSGGVEFTGDTGQAPSSTDDSSSSTDDSLSSTDDSLSSTDDSSSSTGDGDSDPDSGAPAAVECAGGEVEACNSCGQRSCDAEAGVWGPCLPAEEPRCNEERTALEVCNGSGNWETQECTNPDPASCTAACAVPDGVAACVVSAVDADEDGYLSAACEAAPGDDCDDTTQSVSPGSSEVCDGRDNDCDGYTDVLDSTVSLAGSPRSIYGTVTDLRHMDITWHGSEFFFVADGRPEADSGTGIYSGYAPVNGGAPIAAYMGYGYDSPRVASVGGTLGAVARHVGRASGPQFHTLDASGMPLTSSHMNGAQGTLGKSDGEFTLVSVVEPSTSGDSFNTFYFATGATDGTLGPLTMRDDVPGLIQNLRLAQVGSVAGVVYTDSSAAQPSVQLLRWSGENVLGPTELSASAQSADIASLSSNQFAITWATAAGFRLQVRATNGTLVCDSEQVTFGNGNLDALDSVAVAESNLGIVVAVADSGATTGQAAAFIFNDECEPLTEGGKALFNNQLPDHQYRPHEPRIAVGGGNIAFTWTAEDAGSYRSYVRVMPEAMCE